MDAFENEKRRKRTLVQGRDVEAFVKLMLPIHVLSLLSFSLLC